MDANGSAAGYYGGGGGGGGVSLSANAQTASSAGQITATLSGKSGGQGANGFVWVFWPF
jgi:hypothetical protein